MNPLDQKSRLHQFLCIIQEHINPYVRKRPKEGEADPEYVTVAVAESVAVA
jgi:hypothetical protein